MISCCSPDDNLFAYEQLSTEKDSFGFFRSLRLSVEIEIGPSADSSDFKFQVESHDFQNSIFLSNTSSI